jgi:hypothetical protein
MMRRGILAALVAAVALGGACARKPRGAALMPFKAKLSETREDPAVFAVTVTPTGGAGLEQLRESIRYPATVHCIGLFGTSTVLWQTDPASGDWAFSRSGDQLVFRGQCLT